MNQARAMAASITVIVALSAGIGLCALMFSVIDGAILSTLPFKYGDRIARITRSDFSPVSAETYLLGGAAAILRRAGHRRRAARDSPPSGVPPSAY